MEIECDSEINSDYIENNNNIDDNISSNVSYLNLTRLREEDNETQIRKPKEIYINQNGNLVHIDKVVTNVENKQGKELYQEQEKGPYKLIISLKRKYINTRKDKNHIKIWKAIFDSKLEAKEITMNIAMDQLWLLLKIRNQLICALKL